jgi:1,4-alpha-glucan branching enzyme
MSHPLHPRSNGFTGRYSARNFSIPVNFSCAAPEAQRVSLLGDFNNWQPEVHPMKRQPDGNWSIQVRLAHGHHHYVFWVDGTARLDPRAQGIGRNERNEKVSLIAVS